MWVKLLRSRAVHMAVVSGVSVYVLLTIVGMYLNESEHVSMMSKRQQQLLAVQRDDRIGHPVVQPPDTKMKSVRHNPLVAALPAAAADTDFVYRGKQDPDEQYDPHKLDTLAEMLQGIQVKLDGSERGRRLDIGVDLKDVQNVIKELMDGGKSNTSGQENRDSGPPLLEEPENPEPPKKVGIDELPFLTDESQPSSQCPKTVQTLAKYSKWFRTRYEHRIKLFMDFEDIRGYQNYHKLDHYTLPFGFRRTKRDQLGAIFRHPSFINAPLFGNEERPQCLRCAVVGCGGILNGSNAGAEIDSHDLVFRLNRAISSDRFALDVGVKTSAYTFFPESMHAQDVVDENALYVYMMFKQYDIDYLENIVKNMSPPIYTQKGKHYKLKKPPVPPDRLKVLHPDFSRYVFTHYLDGKSHRPTTGAMVVMLAVHICDEVTIYGFGYDERFTLHYYDKAFVQHTDKSTALHDVDNERGLWNRLHEEGVIRFFKRDL